MRRGVFLGMLAASLCACGQAYMGPSKTSTYLIQNGNGQAETVTVRESKPSASSSTTNYLITNSSGRSSFYTIQSTK